MRFHVLLLCSAVLAGCQTTSRPPDQPTLVELLPGFYVGENDGEAIYHKIVPITAPRLGETTFYHQISRGGFDGSPVQQKIYVIAPDRRTMKALVVAADNDKYENLEKQLLFAFRLRAESFLQFPDVCDFAWERQGDRFIGRVDPAVCQYDSPAFGEQISPEMKYEVSASHFVLTETLYRANGQAMFPTTHMISKRAN